MSHLIRETCCKSKQDYRIFPSQELIDEVLKYLRKTIHNKYLDVAVDVGCGTGEATELLAPHFLTVVGIDIDPFILATADDKEHAPNVCFRDSPAEDLPFEDDSVDLITSMSAHRFDQADFLKQVHRILSPGGCLALLSYTMDVELEYGDKSQKLNEICQEFYAALSPYEEACDGSSSVDVYRKIYDSVPYRDKEWHECLTSRIRMPLWRFIGLIETFSTYQCFLEKKPAKAQRLSKTIKDRLLKEMGTLSTDTEVTAVVKYFYFLASKPKKS